MCSERSEERGFTLLEILIALALMAMLAAMVWPALGRMDDDEREGITIRRMEEIREALLGPPERLDRDGNRIIGGFVGDMHRWPFLWEPRPEVRQDVSGVDWSEPTLLPPGVGQYSGDDAQGEPLYELNPGLVYFRPGGSFEGKRWKWHRPFRRVHADDSDNDHIGGPETENEGQPRGLWTRHVEDLPVDLAEDHSRPGYVLDDRWKGPYLVPPTDSQRDDSHHFARSDADYARLEPRWNGATETWEDGDYDTVGGLGEYFDEKERFRKLQSDDRLVDGWGHAFRFFITDDPEAPGESLFWVVSEGPDGDGTYPTKGDCSGFAWTVDSNDTMEQAYDPAARYNQDNILMKLASRDWSSLLASERRRHERETETLIDRIARAVLGTSPTGENTGCTGNLLGGPEPFSHLDFPILYLWEETPGEWDHEDAFGDPYTRGQPRGLWTRTPTPYPEDDLPAARFGVGWHHAYLTPPAKTGADNRLVDSWGNPIQCFRDEDQLLVLSAGPDGLYDFGDPSDPAELVEISDYNGTIPVNADNLVRILDKSEWTIGFLHLPKLTILNAASVTGALRCRLIGVFDRTTGVRADPTWTSGDNGTLADGDLDGTEDDWVLGVPAFRYNDTTTEHIASGPRYLVCWVDDGDGAIETGERGLVKIFQVLARPNGEVDEVILDATGFAPLP